MLMLEQIPVATWASKKILVMILFSALVKLWRNRKSCRNAESCFGFSIVGGILSSLKLRKNLGNFLYSVFAAIANRDWAFSCNSKITKSVRIARELRSSLSLWKESEKMRLLSTRRAAVINLESFQGFRFGKDTNQGIEVYPSGSDHNTIMLLTLFFLMGFRPAPSLPSLPSLRPSVGHRFYVFASTRRRYADESIALDA